MAATVSTRAPRDPSAARSNPGEAHCAAGAAILVAIVEVAARSSAVSDWSPGFVDCLHFPVMNSSVVSPTDIVALSHRAKMVMSIESLSAMVLMVIVIARGVGVLR